MSSTDAEYMSLSESTKEAIHLQSCVSERLDQMGAKQLSKNPVFQERTKHVDLR